MAKINTRCKTCGTQYYHCYACPADLYHPSWRSLFHDENCKEIFTILGRHGQGLISAEEAKELLAECDLSQKETFNEGIKNHIALVCGNDVNVQKETEQDVQDVQEEIVNIDVTEVRTETTPVVSTEETEEIPTTILPFKAKKKKNKGKK